MSIVTFWNDDREQSGKTMTAVAVATKMAIERNFRILLISTSYNDPTIKNCYWGEDAKKTLKLFGGKNNNIGVENGISGLEKLVASNKLTPSTITDYTRVIFKERLEVINGFSKLEDKTPEENLEEYKKIEACYLELIKMANQYYDMVIVDLDKLLNSEIQNEIKNISNLNIYVFSQRLECLNRFNNLKNETKEIAGPKNLPVVGRYLNNTKYNIKNITKYLAEKKELHYIPFNMQFYEAAEENGIVDMFLKMRNIRDKTDDNYIFMQNVLKLTNDIMKKLQELQMKMR